MAEIIFPAAVLLAAFLAAWSILLGAVGGLRITRTLPQGAMHYFFLALILSNGLAVLVSTRNFSLTGEFFDTQLTANPVASWSIRLTSLLALIASADQIARRLRIRAHPGGERLMLAFALLLFWTGNIVIPTLFSAHRAQPQLSWVYAPIVGAGLVLMTPEAGRRCLDYSRNALIVFCAVSLLLIIARPSLVLQTDYTQGYLGIPRFAGLAPHALTMGLVACVGIWCLLTRPLQSKFNQRVALAICLLALFLAQSKAIWISLILTSPILIFNRIKLPSFNEIASSRYRGLIITAVLLIAVALIGLVAALALGGFDQKLSKLMASDEGSRIMSFTGRDRIWEVALNEWHKAPIFGYGIPLFGAEHQIQIAMPFATSGHNQLIDTLGRSGLIGASTLVLYTGCLLYMGIRYGRASRGLSAVLVIAIVIRMISEVPLNMATVGLESIAHYLLLVSIAIGAPLRQARAAGLAR
ncbi:MAG: O-antigen ligase family protein [Burkholderiaceae bacterium]